MNNADQQFSIITAVQSGSAAVRLREARRFLEQFEPGAEVLLLGASLRLRHFSMPMITAFLDILAEVHLGIEVFAWLIAAG
jgi:hypothetical protein